MNEEKKTYLLVSFQETNEVLQQELLELAVEHGMRAYSSEDDVNSYIFEESSLNSLFYFEERLKSKDFPVEITRFSR